MGDYHPAKNQLVKLFQLMLSATSCLTRCCEISTTNINSIYVLKAEYVALGEDWKMINRSRTLRLNRMTDRSAQWERVRWLGIKRSAQKTKKWSREVARSCSLYLCRTTEVSYLFKSTSNSCDIMPERVHLHRQKACLALHFWSWSHCLEPESKQHIMPEAHGSMKPASVMKWGESQGPTIPYKEMLPMT